MHDSSQIPTLETGLKYEGYVLFIFGEVEGQHVHVVRWRVGFAGVGAGIFWIVDDKVEESFGKHHVLHLFPQRFFQNILLGDLDWLVGIIGSQEFRLARQEHIISNAM